MAAKAAMILGNVAAGALALGAGTRLLQLEDKQLQRVLQGFSSTFVSSPTSVDVATAGAFGALYIGSGLSCLGVSADLMLRRRGRVMQQLGDSTFMTALFHLNDAAILYLVVPAPSAIRRNAMILHGGLGAYLLACSLSYRPAGALIDTVKNSLSMLIQRLRTQPSGFDVGIAEAVAVGVAFQMYPSLVLPGLSTGGQFLARLLGALNLWFGLSLWLNPSAPSVAGAALFHTIATWLFIRAKLAPPTMVHLLVALIMWKRLLGSSSP